ncbi:Macrolide export ATP-binding/permease protein MacB [Caulifigura coniformis]|uniref:Macrolide export ATP-binding/permease protein MacB n=1 Tax=Caulifigura coniformis TaxID=2527983 RepID=A0A517SCQ7_9PLAN|nr:FtsX-like permease family protein [Caulifigura coniformis]QDT53903.1 Macrolide export ATP-binding/permease protein MacB [Caulifigura coniformis]
MNLIKLIQKELSERPVPMLTCLLAIVLGVTSLVAIRTVTTYSELAVMREVDSLGANVLILPKDVSLQDYYAADSHGQTLPEEYVDLISLSTLEGVDNLSPKLSVPATVGERKVTVTGILPKSEFQAKAAWGGAGVFARPIGCGSTVEIPGKEVDHAQLARKRVIETLGEREVLVGSETATKLALREDSSVTLFGEAFKVLAVLPATGTVDDDRIFAHLHSVQELSASGPVVNVIEIVGCCKEIAGGLVGGLNSLLPDAKVVTITQVVQTQQNVNRLMENLSLLFLAVLLAVGGAAMASSLFANVSERRKEIGTLMALGATPSFILRLIMGKALALGLVGGVFGFALGSVAAFWLGPLLANVGVRPIPMLAGLSVGLSVLVALVASLWPAWRASRLDPCLCFKEV